MTKTTIELDQEHYEFLPEMMKGELEAYQMITTSNIPQSTWRHHKAKMIRELISIINNQGTAEGHEE